MNHVFSDRQEAARELAQRLAHLRGQRPVVGAVSTGAVPLAAELAALLEGDLDVVLVAPVSHPLRPASTVASVDETGAITPHDGSLSDAELRILARHDLAALRRRRRAYDVLRGPVDPAGRVAVVVDDGAGTATALVAGVRALVRRGAARVVVAAPVVSAQALTELRREVDEVVSVHVAPTFGSVDAWYASYPRVSDDDVLRALTAPAARAA